MKHIIFIFSFILVSLTSLCFCNTVEVNILVPTFGDSIFNATEVEQEYNDYVKLNNYDIKVNVDSIEFEKPTDTYTHLKNFVESLLKKSNNKYDIIYYDSKYSSVFGSYLLDLKDYVSKEFVDMYDPKMINEACMYNDELIGLPASLFHEVLYSNKMLLSKHNKPIPQTWDELIETCKYIMNEEQDPELICYNGLFDDSEQGLFSLYQFIYSCRDSINSEFPAPQDPSFVDALTMLKKLKSEVCSDELFKSNENLTFGMLFSGKAIFLKYWYIIEPMKSMIPYNISLLPGLKKGISGSMVVSNNLGIVKNIPKEKLDSVLKVFDYITSFDYQKKIFVNGVTLTSIMQFFEDEDICKVAPCELNKSLQYTAEPKYITNGPVDYAKKFKESIYQYMYDNKPLDKTLKSINDITKTYSVSFNTELSSVGLISLIFIIVVSLLMLSLLYFLNNKKFNDFFIFLSKDFWIVTVLGSIIILWIPLTNYGSVEPVKCHLKPFLMSIGFTFIMYPSLQKLISQFPEQNKILMWVTNNKYIFFLVNVLMDILLSSIFFIDPYTRDTVLNKDGENFNICKLNGVYSLIIMMIYKFTLLFLLLFLLFVEWNISANTYDMRLIISATYVNILSGILIIIFYIIQIENYIAYFILQCSISIFISISNFIFMYGFRILLIFFNKQNAELELIQKIRSNFKSSEIQSTTVDFISGSKTEENSNTSSTKKNNFFSRMVEYHNYKPSSSTISKPTSDFNSNGISVNTNNTGAEPSVNSNSLNQ